MHKASAEEKLLRLIKDATGKKEKPKVPEAADQNPSEVIKEEPVFKARRKPAVYTKRIERILKIPDLPSLDIILRVGLILMALIFIFDIIQSNIHIKQVLTESEKTPEGTNLNLLPEKLSGDFSRFSSDINNRDIFITSPKSTLDSYTINSGPSIAQYVNKLKLLGTISGEKQQAIIEDETEQKNYTVSAGDYLKDFLVEEVGSGKVRLDYKGEKFDLFL